MKIMREIIVPPMTNNSLPDIEVNWALFFDVDSDIQDGLPASIFNALRKKLDNAVTNINSLGVRSTENLQIIQRLVPKFDELKRHYPLLKIDNTGKTITVDYSARPFLRRMVINYLKLIILPYAGILSFQEGNMMATVTLEMFNKALIIKKFMQYAPFAGRVPVLVGGKQSNDNDIVAVNQMGGVSIGLENHGTKAAYQYHDRYALRQWIKSNVNYPTQMVLADAANIRGERDAQIC